MSSQKPLIVPWLISQIDSKVYPRLEWVNSEQTKFRVPWKDVRRQDWSSDDIKIFEAWAIASGCYNPLTDSPDPARWKRNFRTALLQKDEIQMIENHSSDAVNPHKIYEISIPAHEAVLVGQSNSATTHPTSTSFNNQDIDRTKELFEELEFLNLQEGEELDYPYENLQDIVEAIDPHPSLLVEQTFNVTEHLDEGAAAATPVFQEGNAQSLLIQDQETFQQQILKHFSCNSFNTDFEVKIYYRGLLVKTAVVTNPHGFYIAAEQKPSHSGHLDCVILPQPASVVHDQILIEAIDHILATLKEGTLVEVREGVICVKRFGHCSSYWSMTNTPQSIVPNNISKTEYSIVYSIHEFITELIAFVEERRKESPHYSIWICLGEQWPNEQKWQKKCIMVQVTPVAMRLLHELSYSTGASSLKYSGINLEISDSLSSTNNLLSLLRSIEDMMDYD
ncbi:hypothetical protein GDO81_013755 [Engystomops pustulosus]|uniref:IRF tryptophan pentad repeat domain-containing protein n=1 Tax=Engystomops pustulosus TaxID=76066 RepID=A0AAV7B5D5_ENGPU|nr:hypothetical protein GDO81_013755 [Engystomops pustulosus]